jgi:Na+/H+ antiporter NhaD/arsenite permease-like protein
VSETAHLWLTLLWFTLTYTGLALGRLPGLRTDRAGIALVGAALVLATGLLSFDEAVRAVDFATLVLLLGMMIVVGFLRQAGFFTLLANAALGRVHSPRALLAVTILLAGVLSALLVNDVVCLALAPLVLHLARKLRVDPKPHLIGLALASNAGSVATLTGNPQNMILGGLSHLSYLRFAEKLAPVAVLSLGVCYLVTAWVCRKTLRPAGATLEEKLGAVNGQAIPAAPARPLRTPHKLLLAKSLLVLVGAVGLFFAGAPMELVAPGAAAVLLLGRVKPEKVYRHVDWGLLVMFAGLFVVVHAFEVHVMQPYGIEDWDGLRSHPIGLLSLVSAGLSNLVSNVPAVLLFKPIIPALPTAVQETAWLALAMSSTLAGNLTVLGSVANLIVVESAKREGVVISLKDSCRVGVPVTVLTLLLGVAWLRWVPY